MSHWRTELTELISTLSRFNFAFTVDPHRPFEANDDDWGYQYLYKGTDANAAVSAVLSNMREGVMLIWVESGDDHHWIRLTVTDGQTHLETCTHHVSGWTAPNSCIVHVLSLGIKA